MSNTIDAYYIRKRKLLKTQEEELHESDNSSLKYCAVLSKVVRDNPTYDSISRFIEECGYNSDNSNTYIRECIEAVNIYGKMYPQLISLVCDRVIPNLDDFTLNDIKEDADMMQNDRIRYYVTTLSRMNETADNVLANHDKILKVFNTEEFVEENKQLDDGIIVDKIASVINEFEAPTYGKFIITLEEVSYCYPTIDKDTLVNEAYEYFCIACNPDESIKESMRNVVKNSPMIPNNISINESDAYYNIRKDYIYNKQHNVETLRAEVDNLMNSSSLAIRNKFSGLLHLLTKIVCNSPDNDLVKFVYETLIPEFKDRLIDKLADEVEGMDILVSIKHDIESALQDSTDRFNIFNGSNSTDLYQYLSALKMFANDVTDTIDIFYPSYNMECMLNLTNESVTTISLEEFKVFKFDNLVTRLWKVDKFLQKKFNQFKDKVKAKIYKVRSKIFENADIYEFLDINGNLDYCISSFAYSPDSNFLKLHEFCVSCIREINNTEFKDTEYICYYEITGDTIEFRVRSNTMSISLTEEDRSVLNEVISFEDMKRVSSVMLIGDLIKADFDFVRESIEFFSKNKNRDKFRLYLELCSTAGIDKEIIKEVYYNSLVISDDPTAFTITNSYLYDSYQPSKENLVEVSYEAIIGIQTLLEDGSNLTAAEKRRETIRKKQEEQLRRWEEEEEDDDDDDEDEKEDKKKEEVKKDNKPEQKKPEPKKEEKPKMPSPKDVEGMSFMNKLKIYGLGLAKYAKTATTNIKTKIMNMNSSSDRLGKAIKSALISDRKEAIIKGSVIPSFHKCIMIAVGLAGLWAFNPPIAIISAIAGFSVSKNLTKKERALMYDDVLIELKIVEKELQMAEDKNQIKKMRELMRIKKELERTAARIKIGSTFGRDIIPGGYYVNREED